MYFENFSPGTSFEAGRTPRARGPGRLWKAFAMGGSRELCSGSRELWEGCRKFWKGFWAKGIDFSLNFHDFLGAGEAALAANLITT